MHSENNSSQLQTIQWQFQLTWQLAQFHLPALTDDACLWKPTANSWTVSQSAAGTWHPDWSVPEPDPAPPTTIGWLTWHMTWWWSGVLAAVRNETPAAYHEVTWPGSANAVVQRLESLSVDWATLLSELSDGDLDRPLAYPWPDPQPLRLALAWTNSELMKNVAEIGYIRHLFEASRTAKPVS